MTAVGLNFFDTLLLRNQYQVSPPLPFSPGAEIAGTVEGFGADVTGFKLGQRVVAYIGGNGCREKVVTKAKNVVPIPDGVSDEVAAGIPVTYGTATARPEGSRQSSARRDPGRARRSGRGGSCRH